jgi:hypothetical protein
MKQSGNIPFIFINSSLDRPGTSPSDSFTISSHVSKTHRARLKEEKWQRLRQSTTRFIAQRPIRPAASPLDEKVLYQGPALIPSDAGQAQGRTWESSRFILKHPSGGHRIAPNANSWDSSQHALPFQAGQDTGDQQDLQPLDVLAPNHEKPWNTFSPSLVLWKGNSDPFTTTAVPLNAQNNEILRQAQKFFIFTAWPETADAVFRTPIADTKNSHVKLEYATQDEGLLHAILASGYRVDSRLVTTSRESRRAKESAHKARAVAVLRQRLLSGEASRSIISLIRVLISLEFDDDDHPTALLHLRGLLAMALSRPSLLLEAEGLLLVSDVWIALSLRKRPEISPTRYDPGGRHLHSFNAALLLEIGEGSPPSPTPIATARFVKSQYGLDQRTIYLLNSAVEIVRTKDLMINLEDPCLQQQVVKWMHRRATAVSGYLIIGYLDANESTQLPNQTPSVNIRQAVIAASCLAGILFMNLEFCESSSNYNFSKLFQAIEPALRSVSDDLITADSASDRELYLWLLFMCALGSDVYSARGDISYSRWPAGIFGQLRKHLQLHSLQDVKRVLHTFLYHDVVDEFLVGLLLDVGETPTGSILTWTRWCSILKHYVPDSQVAPMS